MEQQPDPGGETVETADTAQALADHMAAEQQAMKGEAAPLPRSALYPPFQRSTQMRDLMESHLDNLTHEANALRANIEDKRGELKTMETELADIEASMRIAAHAVAAADGDLTIRTNYQNAKAGT